MIICGVGSQCGSVSPQQIESSKKVVLAYSGGLDTSIAIPWLKEKYDCQVIAVTVDVGQQEDLESLRNKALMLGAKAAEVIDAKDEFASDFISPAIKGNALYEDCYPLSTALARPLVAKKLAEVAESYETEYVAHGCTGKGNDQVRFDVSLQALNPNLKVLAPARTWRMSREDELEYAKARHLPCDLKGKIYSVDQNLWGRSIEGGELENISVEPSEDAFEWTIEASEAPSKPEYFTLLFESGVPVALNGKSMSLASLVSTLNVLAGAHGVGRIDHIESRVVGIKSREVYECPAAETILAAHKALEHLTLPKDLLSFKRSVEDKFADLVYEGLWFTSLRSALTAFIDETQERVTGTATVKLHKGKAQVVALDSVYSLYDFSLATYGAEDTFDQTSAEGFVKLFGLPVKIWSLVGSRAAKAFQGGKGEVLQVIQKPGPKAVEAR